MTTNATIRYSGDPKDILKVSLAFIKEKSFLELSTLFSLSYSSYQSQRNSMINLIVNAKNKRYFDDYWGHHMLSYTSEKKGIRITINNRMLLLMFFLKDPDSMIIYSKYPKSLGASVINLIEYFELREEFPEFFL